MYLRVMSLEHLADRLTIKNGATIQLTKTLKPTWIQSCFERKVWCSVSYLTLHKIGYIMTSKPIAKTNRIQSAGVRSERV
jgi:hypothetical protein